MILYKCLSSCNQDCSDADWEIFSKKELLKMCQLSRKFLKSKVDKNWS